MTPDEQNDAIREQVEAEIPKPVGGFESADQEDALRDRRFARFLELVHNPKLWTFTTKP